MTKRDEGEVEREEVSRGEKTVVEDCRARRVYVSGFGKNEGTFNNGSLYVLPSVPGKKSPSRKE